MVYQNRPQIPIVWSWMGPLTAYGARPRSRGSLPFEMCKVIFDPTYAIISGVIFTHKILICVYMSHQLAEYS